LFGRYLAFAYDAFARLDAALHSVFKLAIALRHPLDDDTSVSRDVW
jgi:hypothetical protein